MGTQGSPDCTDSESGGRILFRLKVFAFFIIRR